MTSSAASHAGRIRNVNQDAVLARPEIGLWAVADGAGGHGAGEVASAGIATALEQIPPGLSPAELLAQVRLSIDGVHAGLQQQAGSQVMASTLVALLLRGQHFAVLWAGDSRAYLLRDGALHRLTRDHSVVQEMVDAGTLAPDAAERHPQANVITRAVGAPGELRLDKVADRLMPRDRFLLCSDGLFKELPETRIAAMLAAGADAPALVSAAIEAGGRDNVSAVLVQA